MKAASRTGLAAFMAVAGAAHFVIPEFYERIVPRVLGHERLLVRATGVAELACAMLLARRRTAAFGGWATATLFVVVFPANVQMALDGGVRARAISSELRGAGVDPVAGTDPTDPVGDLRRPIGRSRVCPPAPHSDASGHAELHDRQVACGMDLRHAKAGPGGERRQLIDAAFASADVHEHPQVHVRARRRAV